MKIMVTIIPTDLVSNFLFFLSNLTNQKQESDFQQVSGLLTRNISVYNESRSTSKPFRIQ